MHETEENRRMIPLSAVAVGLSAIAVLLSLVAIRRQSIPSKYEAERRVREELETPNGEPEKEYNDVTFYMNYVNISRHKGLHHRIKELVFGDIFAETQVVFSPSKDFLVEVEVEKISTIDDEGVRALMFKMDTTNPLALYNQFSESVLALSRRV